MTPYEHKVQYYETDGMGIVHHSNYIRWFEEARVDLLEQLGYGYDRIESEGFSSPVLEVSCKYKTMARFGDTVRIYAEVSDYNGVRLSLHYEVRDAQTNDLRCIRECVQRAGLKRKLCAVQRAFEKYHSILPRHILRREEASVRCAGSNAESFCSSDRLAVVCGFRHVCEGSLGVNHSAVQRITHSVSTIQHHNKISPGNRLSRIKQMIAPALNDPRH